MTSRPYALFMALIGVICAFAIFHAVFGAARFAPSRTLRNELVQAIFVGGGLGLVTANVLARIRATKINGWITIYGCGVPGNGLFLRAACAQVFLGPVNVPEEAMYWTTTVDGARHTLSGAHAYIMRFPAGGLPPNDAFWSLTMGDARNRFVANPIHRYSVSDRSGLVPNADGSVDVYIQRAAPAGRESNWLPAPAGRFVLWLRAYMPGTAILNGTYTVPPVVEVR